ncbi:ATP-binding cassette domain-containing protein [Streptomyces sp. WAC06614]|uniref:ATP-binding cassette domain-containing protein n=1 Tax=Streptomyces sp. WAC06614 TaxID=2487416 RepID=UPI000F78A1B9|nr:ATP-binding cassette domain-containing protein [Streptomyces sp. WAC06614]RSS72788.1 ATP-binding cassette domain-containing protein [Streptomyces sp. WAC06614]
MALVFDDIVFRYGRQAPVFTGLRLVVEAPATVLLGPNGAGKSTLMAIAASQLAPVSGTVSFNRARPDGRRQAAYRKRVAWIPQHITPVPGLTVREQVAYAGWLKGMGRRAAWDASARAVEQVGLGKLADRKSHQVSGGQLRRMGIAGALTHHSELILMDEPTAGLDPQQRQMFRQLVSELSHKVQVLVSTHQTEDLADLYHQVVVLDQGVVRFQASPAQFHALAPAAQGARERAEAAYALLVGQEI